MSYPEPAMGAPPMGPPGMGGPPMGGGGLPPNLLPFASTQPGGIQELAAPLLAQQQMDREALQKQQLEAVMAVVMQQMQQMPNPAAEAAQTEPSAPMSSGPGAPPPVAGDPMNGGM